MILFHSGSSLLRYRSTRSWLSSGRGSLFVDFIDL